MLQMFWVDAGVGNLVGGRRRCKPIGWVVVGNGLGGCQRCKFILRTAALITYWADAGVANLLGGRRRLGAQKRWASALVNSEADSRTNHWKGALTKLMERKLVLVTYWGDAVVAK